MIINTGQRTDIPAFYSRWFLNRLKAGFVMVRNPFNPIQVTRYDLDPSKVDVLCFCTKNPAHLLPYIEKIPFRQVWHVTITPYGKEIEPKVPPKEEVIASFRALSEKVGNRALTWRYDPIFLSGKYDFDFHLRAFDHMASAMKGSTETVVISFIDLYSKIHRNFPEVTRVSHTDQYRLAAAFVSIAKKYGMEVVSCHEDPGLQRVGVHVDGCFTKERIEKAIGEKLKVPANANMEAREGCSCLLGHDIGAYNSCRHLCRYCYANYDQNLVLSNWQRHDDASPFLIGNSLPGDIVTEAREESWIEREVSLFENKKAVHQKF